MKKLILLLLFLVSINASSATLYSICDDGNWSDQNCWSNTSGGLKCNCIPSSSDIVYIESTMNLDVNITIGTSGSLTISSGVMLTSAISSIIVQGNLIVDGDLTVFNLELKNNSNLYINTGATVTVYGTFTNNNNSGDVVINGTLNTNNFVNGTGSGAGADITGSGIITASMCTSPGSVMGTSGCVKVVASALPIELISFDVSMNGRVCLIEWITASETNNKLFSIEKSKDAYEFKSIAKIKGAKDSRKLIEYLYIDTNVLIGNSYYRLKQIDYDGKFTYSNVVLLINTIENEILVEDTKIKNNSDVEISIQIHDLSGKKVYDTDLNPGEQISIEHIPEGIYFLKHNNITIKLIKL